MIFVTLYGSGKLVKNDIRKEKLLLSGLIKWEGDCRSQFDVNGICIEISTIYKAM